MANDYNFGAYEQERKRQFAEARKLSRAASKPSALEYMVKREDPDLAVGRASGQLLKQAWLNIPDTFGLSFFYIIIHWIGAYLVPGQPGRIFCKFGREWVPKGTGQAASKEAGRKLEILEIIAFGAGCLILGALVAAALVILTLFFKCYSVTGFFSCSYSILFD